MDFETYNWVNDAEKSCEVAMSLLNKVKEKLNNENYVCIKEKLDQIQSCINQIQSESLSLSENNFYNCLDMLEKANIISLLGESKDEFYYAIAGLENCYDKRCKGFYPIDFRYFENKHIGFRCKKMYIQGIYDNKEYDEKVCDILKESIHNENVTYRVMSSMLYNTKGKTIAEVEIEFTLTEDSQKQQV